MTARPPVPASDADSPVRPDPFPVDRLPAAPRGRLVVPGSKSLTNRLLVLAALARGRSRLRRPLRSTDCDGLTAALAVLGVTSRWVDGPDEAGGPVLEVDGVGGRFPHGGRVDLGDGGTPARFMMAVATLAAGDVEVDGSPRMRERPVAEGAAMLRALGATIDGDRLPLQVRRGAGPPAGGSLVVGRTASSQFVSAAMLIAPWLPAGLDLELGADATSRSYVALTAGVLEDRGLVAAGTAARLEAAGPGPVRVRIPPAGDAARGFDVTVEPDASSAIYWFAAAAMRPGASLTVPGIGRRSAQPDVRLVSVLESAGARVQESSGPDGPSLTVTGGPDGLGGFTCDASGSPDGALMLAAAAAVARGPSRITGLETLRIKESDRLAALRDELRRCGAGAEITGDAITVTPIEGVAIDAGPARSHAPRTTVETYDDHRIAMAFAVLGLVRGGVAIRDPGCVAKSYPGFWDDLEQCRRLAGDESVTA